MDVELLDIHKAYGAVHANRGISLRAASGTVHGILGENGAGKSTLMKILAGYTLKDRGSILLGGRPAAFTSPAMASRSGIGMLYQDPLDFPWLTVLENFMLSPTAERLPSRSRHARRLKEWARRFGFQLDPRAAVETLTIGERQQLELLRLLNLGVNVLILDEPTTGISTSQKSLLFAALKQLAAEGKSVLLVSHKLEDVESLCDRVTVLRQGRVVSESAAPFDTRKILRDMFGGLPSPPPRCTGPPGEPILVFDGVSAEGGRAGLTDCSVTIRRGEVVGLAGLEGSGQGVFLRVAAGLEPSLRGTVRLFGETVDGADYHAFRRRGVGFLPAARLEEGLIPGLSLTEHVALASGLKGLAVPWARAADWTARKIRLFNIRGAEATSAEGLSGGNQQRLLLALLPEDPRLLLLEQPTRGLDLESAHWVWGHLRTFCERGTAVVFSSSELDEILAVADRVLVFCNGRLTADLPAHEATTETVGRAISGKTRSGSRIR